MSDSPGGGGSAGNVSSLHTGGGGLNPIAVVRYAPTLRIAIPAGGEVRIRQDGRIPYYASLNAAPDTLEIRTDVWPEWMLVAGDQLRLAKLERLSNPGFEEIEDTQFHYIIRREMRYSMTSISASAFTLQAFAESVRHHARLDNQCSATVAGSIHQTLIRSFKCNNKDSRAWRDGLSRLFGLRNAAVHPWASFNPPLRHPFFNVFLEQRFVDFRVEAANDWLDFVKSLVGELLKQPRVGNPRFVEWSKEMSARLSALESDTESAKSSETIRWSGVL